MRPPHFTGCVALLWVAQVCGQNVAAAATADADVSKILTEVIATHDVPGMTASVINGERVVAIGAAGVRIRGRQEKVVPGDKLHLGSCTKAMTATLCAMLVEEGKLKWTSTIATTFPAARSLHPGYRDVTLEQLLTHRGGAPGQVKDALWASLWQPKGQAARRKVLDTVFALPPEVMPGTEFVYSNFGYALAGHMAEKVGRKSWEELMREKIFAPLKMSSAGFGAPLDHGATRQPRGHTADGTAINPTAPGADNPPAIGPGGTVHCSVVDWAQFVGLHLRASRGNTSLLKADTFRKLQTPPDGSPYAMGWLVGPSPLGVGPALSHAGSNRMWFAVAWILPKDDLAVVVMCNQGEPGGPGEKACDEAAGRLIRWEVDRRPPK